jgi:PAS domain S-box-containing protein
MSPVSKAPEEIRSWIEERLFTSVPVAIAVIDREYNVVLANQQFEDVFGEWRNRPCWQVYKGRPGRCSDCPAEVAFERGEVQTRQEVGKDRHGEEAHYLVQVAPIRRRRDGTIPYCIEMSTDITQVHRLEQEKIEAERMAAVGQTVAGLAHGIKNIITGLEGGMYVMHSGMKKERKDRIDSGWKMLERNVERISVMARNLLAFSKGHTPDVMLVDPGDIVRDIVDLYSDAAARVGVTLAAEVPGRLPLAFLDAHEIHGCLANLVSNAIDACQMSDREEGRVTVRAFDEAGSLVFEVEDDGVGMDVEVKRKIFTTFFTTKGSSGTGLGMLLIRKVVQEHGGTVSVYSEVGTGSRIRIVLPRHRLPQPAAEREEEDGQAGG